MLAAFLLLRSLVGGALAAATGQLQGGGWRADGDGAELWFDGTSIITSTLGATQGYGLIASGGGAVYFDNGLIRTNGTQALGASVESGGYMRIRNSSIETVGEQSWGFRSIGVGTDAELTNVNITTNGVNAWAVDMTSGGHATLNNVNLVTNGLGAYGARLLGLGTVLNMNGGSITTNYTGTFNPNGNYTGAGVFAETGAVANLTDVDIRTYGGGSQQYASYGIMAAGANSAINMTGGTITTSGLYSHGAVAYGSNIYLDGVSVSTTGTSATYGVYALNYNNAPARVVIKDSHISTTGQTSYGIRATNTGTEVLMSGGSIKTIGTGAHGVSAASAAAVSLDAVRVETEGYGGHGAVAQSDAVVTVTGGSVETKGGSAYGLLANGGDVYADGVVIVTSGDGSYGAYTYGGTATYSSYLEFNNGSITVKGNQLYGLGSSGAYNKLSASNSTVTTTGSQAYGAFAGSATTISLDTVDIETSGSSSHGVYSTGSSTVGVKDSRVHTTGYNAKGIYMSGGTLTADGVTISTEGDEAEGLYLLGSTGSSKISNSSITTLGDDSAGVYTSNNGNKTEIADTFISTGGEDAFGVRARNYSVVSLDRVAIETTGLGATGVRADTSGSVSLAGGYVLTKNNNASALEARSQTSIRDGGSIYADGVTLVTEGDNSHGVSVHGYYSSADIKDSVILTSGAGSHGVNAWGHSTAKLNGLTIYADDTLGSYAIYAAGQSGEVALVNGEASVFNIEGAIVADSYSSIDLTMEDGSVLLGRTSVGSTRSNLDLTLNGAASVWGVTADSTLTTLNLDGSTVDFRTSPAFIKITAEDLNPSASGTGGILLMKADIPTETADLLKITNTTNGTHIIDINNDTSARTNGTEITLLVQTADHGGSFSLTHDVEAGAWLYGLRQNTTSYGSGAGWELYAVDISEPGSDAINTYRASYMLNYAETTLIQRMGDLRESPQLRGVWARFYGGEFEAKSHGAGQAKNFEMSYGGLHVGYDRKLEIGWDGDFYLGVTAGYSAGDLDLRSGGDSDVKSYMVGMYGTFMHPNGFYLDAVLKYRWKNSEFNTYDSTGDYVKSDSISTSGLGWSVEFGQRISFNGTPKDGWYAEPQVQLRYQRQGAGHYNLSNGLRIGADGVTSVIGRLGILVGHEKGDRNYYAKLFRLKEFDGELNVWTGDHDYLTTQRLGGSWWVYGIGLTSKVNDRNYLYCDIERTAGSSDFQQKWRLNAGWRHEI